MEKSLVIGIAGGSGSGKTTLLKNIVETFGLHNLSDGSKFSDLIFYLLQRFFQR